MTSLHVGMNHIPEKEMTEIIVLAMGKESMKLLCEVPIKDKSLTELDVSSKSLGAEGALVVAEYLRDNGAMTSLDVSGNGIGGYFRIPGNEYSFVSTPAGIDKDTSLLICLPFTASVHRPYCYRICHQGHGGHDVAESCVESSLRSE
jgi:hypothetical protein